MFKVLLWGTGNMASSIEANGINAEVIGYIETKKNKEIHNGKKVYCPKEITEDYDYIIVANHFPEEVYQECKRVGLDLSKVIFLSPISVCGLVDIHVALDVLGEKTTAIYWGNVIAKDYPFYKSDLIKYNSMNTRKNFEAKKEYLYPIVKDRFQPAGSMSQYLWQDLWAAKLIYKSGVKKHYDIGSRIDGFITHLLAMDINVTLIDIREYPWKIDNLNFIQDDATLLNNIPDGNIESMSALCSLEHFGLGRYGDTIDPEACFKCIAAIQKKIKQGGHLYISVPIGKERVEFNAHRIFYASTIVDCFCDMKLEEFSALDNLEMDRNIEPINKYDNCNGMLCGLFHFIKK